MKLINLVNKLPRHEERVKTRNIKSIHMIIVHCTAQDDSLQPDVYGIAKYHTSPGCHICPEKGCPTIAYHTVIERAKKDIVVYTSANDEDIVYAVGNWNRNTYNIALNYDCTTDIDLSMYNALVNVLAYTAKRFNLNPYYAIWGHRNLERTGWNIHSNKVIYRKLCPGSLNIFVLQRDVANVLSIPKDNKVLRSNIEFPYITKNVYQYLLDKRLLFIPERINTNFPTVG